jgi:UDP-N-acetylglucosamine 1-carboxyvinyltransferase
MEQMHISGGVPLSGTVTVSGAKNSALPILAASLLTDDLVILEGVPRLSDVETLSELLRGLDVDVQRLGTGAVQLLAAHQRRGDADAELVRRMRASFCVLGPLLARRGRARVPLPGGCRIGDRPVDLHLFGLRALGAEIEVHGDFVVGWAPRLHGADISLAGPRGSTVTGTANVLCAAVLAEGRTTIRSAACEPEVVDLGNFLRALGAQIDGLGTPTIRVQGVPSLHGATYRIIPDRIEAATWLCGAAITRGEIELRHVCPAHLTHVLAKLREIGMRFEIARDSIAARAASPLQAADVIAAPYPQVPTDVQAQLTALLATAAGASIVRDTVFPERLHHVAELARMGACMHVAGDHVMVSGVPSLAGAEVVASDLRASAALVLAGLAADGDTVVHQVQYLDRGYEQLDTKLAALGAVVRRTRDIEIERRAA